MRCERRTDRGDLLYTPEQQERLRMQERHYRQEESPVGAEGSGKCGTGSIPLCIPHPGCVRFTVYLHRWSKDAWFRACSCFSDADACGARCTACPLSFSACVIPLSHARCLYTPGPGMMRTRPRPRCTVWPPNLPIGAPALPLTHTCAGMMMRTRTRPRCTAWPPNLPLDAPVLPLTHTCC